MVPTVSLEGVAETGFDSERHCAWLVRQIRPIIGEHLSETGQVVGRDEESTHTRTKIMMLVEHIAVRCLETDNGEILIGQSDTSSVTCAPW